MTSPQSPLNVTPITVSRHGFPKKLFHTVRHAAKKDYCSSDMLVMNIEMTMTAMTADEYGDGDNDATFATPASEPVLIRYLPILSAHKSRLMQPTVLMWPCSFLPQRAGANESRAATSSLCCAHRATGSLPDSGN